MEEETAFSVNRGCQSQTVSPERNARRRITNLPPTKGKKREELKKKKIEKRKMYG